MFIFHIEGFVFPSSQSESIQWNKFFFENHLPMIKIHRNGIWLCKTLQLIIETH